MVATASLPISMRRRPDRTASGIFFETGDFRVRFVPAAGNDCCAISFCSFTDEPCLDRPGFGESFLLSAGYNAIHVINRTNIWYQYPEMPEALDLIRNFAADFRNVFTYGSSMGGYAALRFAERLGATKAIAISPQFSVSPDVVPFDTRWHAIAKRLNFPLEAGFVGSAQTEPVVFYDPNDRDSGHFRLIEQAFPKTVGVRLKHAGHPAGSFLSEVGLLPRAVTEVVEDRFDATRFEADARNRRGVSGHYLFTLARRQPPWRSRTKLALARLAVERHEDAAYVMYRAILVEETGDFAQAESLLRRAAEILPNHPAPLRMIGHFLLRHGRFEEATDVVRLLLALNPDNTEFRELLRLALWNYGKFDPSLTVGNTDAIDEQQQRSRGLRKRIGQGGFLARMSALMEPYLRLRVARAASLQKELRLMDEWRAPPLGERLIRRFRMLAGFKAKNTGL